MNAKQLNRIFARAMYGMVIVTMVFSATGVAYAEDEPPPNPFIAVSLTQNWFMANNFLTETPITFNIYESKGDADPIYVIELNTDEFGNVGTLGWEYLWNPEPGDFVIATDGVNTKELELEYITLDVFDPDNDFLSGKAAYRGRQVDIGVGNENGEQWMSVIADDNSQWFADFTLPDYAFDITEDSWAGAHVSDEDGDVTAAHNSGPPIGPHFTVFPEWEWFDGLDWPNGATVAITVKDKSVCDTTSIESSEGFFNGGFPDGCDIVVGDEVTFTYGEIIRTHVVQNLTVTKAIHEDDTIKGMADLGADVYVWPHATGEQQLAIVKTKGNAMGNWYVDFSGIYDLVPGECGRSEIRDEFANSTAVDWCISNPRIVASESGDWFWTTEFKPGDLDIFIYESTDASANLLWSGQQVADESGFAFVGSDIHGQDLAPGNYLIVSDGDSQKSLVLQPITMTMFDPQYEIMAGFAPPGSEVWAAAGPQEWQERVMVQADFVTGEWLVDFKTIGFDITEEMRPWSYASVYDGDGDANEGSTPPPLPNLIVIANQADWVDSGITVSAGQSFTVEASGLMNPCSDTYPNGGEICIFYTPVGGEWAVPSENEFGIFPGPGLPFMALLGRIGDGEPFYISEGGTFTAQQSGTMWFTPNDNLRTDNQGAYGVMVGLEP